MDKMVIDDGRLQIVERQRLTDDVRLMLDYM